MGVISGIGARVLAPLTLTLATPTVPLPLERLEDLLVSLYHLTCDITVFMETVHIIV